MRSYSGHVLPGNALILTILIALMGKACEVQAYNWTPKTISILARVMRVVERTTIGSRFESVCETTTRRYWAHRNTRDAVRPLCVLLIDTMPMHGGTLGRPRDGIVHSDLDCVSPIGFDQRLGSES